MVRTLRSLIYRNCKLFFKDKGMFFTSLITPVILLVLYVTFLGNVYRDSFVSEIPEGLVLPEGLTSIGGQAFSGFAKLKSIEFPSSITNIDWTAFSGCDMLKDVYYAGTPEQWSEIAVSTDNHCLLDATIHYNVTID